MTNVKELYKEYIYLRKYLEKQVQPSLVIFVNNNFNKVLVIAAASFFEEEIKSILGNLTSIASSNNTLLVNFVKNKAIERKYHEYFNWRENNANNFFGLFGREFKLKAINDVNKDSKLERGIQDFLELGNTRNLFAHQDFSNIILPKTTDEYYELYKSGRYFINYLRKKLEEEFKLPFLFSFLECAP